MQARLMRGRALFVPALAAAMLAGCAHRTPDPLVDRVIRKGVPKVSFGEPLPLPARGREGAPAARAPRRGEPRPTPEVPAATALQAVDAELRESLALVAAAPTVPHRLRLARAYLRRGIDDQAIDQLQLALAKEPDASAAHELLARVWRNTGLLELALASAHRAVYFAPAEASPLNTLGTVLETLGDRHAARGYYGRAVDADRSAAYAARNLRRMDRLLAADSGSPGVN